MSACTGREDVLIADSATMIRMTANVPGAIGLLYLVDHVEATLAAVTGESEWPIGHLRRVSLADIDDGLAARLADDLAVLMPHGGQRVVQRLQRELARLGVRSVPADEVDPQRLFPEAEDDVEAFMLAALARACSPLAIDLLLDQPRRWRATRPLTRADEERSQRLNRLIDPPSVVIAGPPNVGKSTLSNALFGRSMSIALDMPGTTRDYTSGLLDLGGLVVRWHDTPGVHRADDPIERRAVALADRLIRDADLLVAMNDAMHSWPILPRDPDLRLASRRDLGERDDADLSISAHEPGDLAVLVAALQERLVASADLAHPGPWRFDARLGAESRTGRSD
jgi:hypothetical protein